VIHFYDSSALAKHYMREPGSERVEALLNEGVLNAVCVITHTEIACVLARQVREPARDLADLRRDLETLSRVELTLEVIASSVALGVKYRLRGCDALQLAAAVALKKTTGRLVRFICADAELNVAARAEGLSVIDPGR
jgi:predicted nucleic acid-binding protein